MGSAIASPRGTARRFAKTPPAGNVGAKRARMGAQGIVAATVADIVVASHVPARASARRGVTPCLPVEGVGVVQRVARLAIGRESEIRPDVAPAERRNDTSCTTSGSVTPMASSESPNERADVA